MTATERLRQLLDERGVEWMPSAWSANDETFYKVGEVGYLATELSSGRMKVCIEGYLTPEQAIEAALGRGTCRMTLAELRGPAYTDTYECDWCGHQTMVSTVMGESEPPRFCPDCGRRVVE